LRGELENGEPSFPAASEDAEHAARPAVFPLDVDEFGGMLGQEGAAGTPVIVRGRTRLSLT
jgi:hypothetical protein